MGMEDDKLDQAEANRLQIDSLLQANPQLSSKVLAYLEQLFDEEKKAAPRKVEAAKEAKETATKKARLITYLQPLIDELPSAAEGNLAILEVNKEVMAELTALYPVVPEDGAASMELIPSNKERYLIVQCDQEAYELKIRGSGKEMKIIEVREPFTSNEEIERVMRNARGELPFTLLEKK